MYASLLIHYILCSLGFPKRVQTFLFLVINDAASFKKELKELIPLITTTAQIQQSRKDIANHKASNQSGLLKTLGINIAFTKSGLAKVSLSFYSSL